MHLTELLDLMWDNQQREITLKLHLDEEQEQYIVSISQEQMQKLGRPEAITFFVDDELFTPLRERPNWLKKEL